MSARSGSRKGRSLMRAAVVGAVAIGAPFAVAGTANGRAGFGVGQARAMRERRQLEDQHWQWLLGGLQFSPSTWRAYGGKGSPHNASRKEQIAVAERTLAAQGWNAWPSCSRKAGVRATPAQPQVRCLRARRGRSRRAPRTGRLHVARADTR